MSSRIPLHRGRRPSAARRTVLGGVATALVAAVLVTSGPAQAASVSVTIDDITYSADDANVAAGAAVTGYTGPGGAVTIPSSVTISGQSYDVTSIGVSAFQADALTSVSIPDTVTTIGLQAFIATDLTSLVIPDSVVSIGPSAFRSTPTMTSLTLGSGLTSIGGGAFQFNGLTSIVIPDNVTTMEGGAFANNALTSVSIGSGLTSLEAGVFDGNQLESVTIPSTITAIGANAFDENQLGSVTIPGSVTTIESNAFRSNALTSVTIPATVTAIFYGAFDDNPLTSVRMLGAIPTGPDDNTFPDTATVRFPWRFGDPQTVGGYPTPTWLGNPTVAVVDVAFDTAGGSAAPATQQVDTGGTATEPADPTRAGFVFDGWTLGGTPFDFSTAITEDVELTAAWVAGTAPTITGPASATITLGDALTYTPTAVTGNPAPTVTGSDLPSTLTVNPTTGVVTGTPDEPGTFTLMLKASNGVGPDAELTAEITVQQPAEIVGPDNAAGTQNQAFGYYPGVNGHPAPTVTAEGLPAGLGVDPATGAVTGTPTGYGTFPVTLTASNGVGTASTLNVTITIAQAVVGGVDPVINGQAREGKTLTAHPGLLTPANATVTYQWLADGVPIKKATKPTLKLGKDQAGRVITVRVTASAPGLGSSTETSDPTARVSSSKARLLVSTKSVPFGSPFTVTATGLEPNMPAIIWLGGESSYKGYADATGTVHQTVAFAGKVKPGTRLVRVSGYDEVESDGDYDDREYTITTTVKYLKP